MPPVGERARLGVLGIVLLTALCACSSAGQRPKPAAHLAPSATTYTFSLNFGGRPRSYRLHVPPAAAGGKALPLILNLHGATQNGLLQELYSSMNGDSDKDGYLVAYPDGTRISTVLTPDPVAKDAQYGWNAGACCGLPASNRVDDVGFLLGIISDVATRTPVDLRRVYVTGMSNGGMMAYAMAAEASGHIAAIASVEGQVELATIHPARPVPTLEFHSVDDPVAKWEGAPDARGHLAFSVLSGIDQWVKADGCQATPQVGRTIVGGAGTASAGETATYVSYDRCHAGADVSLWRLTGSGHVWPGSTLNTGPPNTWILDGVGRGTTLVDANQVMWQFFRQYALAKAP
jgi:polyhydroxybutyrate depolymerase